MTGIERAHLASKLTALAVWAVAVVSILTLAIPSVVDLWRGLVPASRWLEVRSVHVAGAPHGIWPAVTVDRVIRRGFRGRWTSTLHIHDEHGRPYHYCSAGGASFYRPEASLPQPDRLTLGWWLDGECALEPGRYTVSTIWVWTPQGYPEKQTSITSNVFTIHPRLPDP